MGSIVRRALPLGFLGLFALACWESSNSEREPEPAWSVQLHVHGSFSEGMGSIDSHSFEAAALGVDAIWWSDHDFRISSYHHVDRFGFEGASQPVDAGEDWKVRLKRHASDTKTIQLASGQPGGMAFVEEPVRAGERSLLLRAIGQGDEFQTQACILAASRKLQRRPLAGGVKLALSILPERITADARPFVRLLLSEHAPREGLGLEQYSLRYYLVDAASKLEPHREGATYHIPVPAEANRWNDLVLEASADVARGFPFAPARDNALYRIIVGVEARAGARSQAVFDELRIEHRERGRGMYAVQAEVIEEVSRLHPDVVQHQGVEISYASRHLNEFSLEAELFDYEALTSDVRLEDEGGFYHEPSFRSAVTQRAIAAAHGRRGLVSYNHMFGVGMEDAPQGRTRETQLEMLLKNAAFGVDLLEVGYRDRAGASLADHLWVWDQLGLAGLRPVGTGVSDSHGGPEERWAGRPNNMLSWIYAPEPSKAALLEGMRAGRVFFGDIELFDGRLDLTSSGGWRMGQEVVFDGERIELELRIEGAEPGDELVVVVGGEEGLRKGLVHADESLRYSRSLAPDESNFVRFELYAADGRAKAFSNPIHWLRPADVAKGASLSAARTGVSVGGLKSTRIDGFALAALERLPGGGLGLSGALEPGLERGSMVFEFSGFGTPDAVRFGGELRGSSRVEGGRLHIELSGGAGSLQILPLGRSGSASSRR